MSSNDKPKARREDVLRPVELLVLSGVLGVFTGLITLMATRDFVLAAIGLGVAFIVSLVLLAMFALSMKPDAGEAVDLDEQNGDTPPPPVSPH
ncbi:hypothetical protein [Compostimonas suwonensis]|uniref:Uncharacterized protein n=1 Tax=Compostimonas suwonensis TaxID=1048394 RepID=A0A2M9C455_9MICO|nr:hypothetical protein [Compostimonas suwonensis]PJJ65320.1 hypothetical protein CLV54_0352 [Compostimonas suwonensis]